jgi:hypothetical protein
MYIDFAGREIEDLERDNMRRDRLEAARYNAIEEALKACDEATHIGIEIADKVSFVQGYLCLDPQNSLFCGVVPADLIESIIGDIELASTNGSL